MRQAAMVVLMAVGASVPTACRSAAPENGPTQAATSGPREYALGDPRGQITSGGYPELVPPPLELRPVTVSLFQVPGWLPDNTKAVGVAPDNGRCSTALTKRLGDWKHEESADGRGATDIGVLVSMPLPFAVAGDGIPPVVQRNPVVADPSDGGYGWLGEPGACYYVRIESPGMPEPKVSPVFGVIEGAEVRDLHYCIPEDIWFSHLDTDCRGE